MNNEPNKVDVKEEELLQVNGGENVDFFYCVNPECANFNIHVDHDGCCVVCGGVMKLGIDIYDPVFDNPDYLD